MNVKVSICIPAYEESELLRKLLDSIIEQSYTDYEVIITDDSVTSKVEDVVNSYDQGDRLKYYRNKETKGSPRNWNESIKQARGEYIKIMHHDDWFCNTDSLKKFVEIMDENQNADFGFCATRSIDAQNNIRIISQNKRSLKLIKRNPKHLLSGLSIGAPSVTMYRTIKKHWFDERLKWFVDVDFYIRLLQENRNFLYIEEPLVVVSTISPNQVTNGCVDKKEIDLFEYIYVINKFQKWHLVDLRIMIRLIRRLVKYRVSNPAQLVEIGIEKELSLFIKIALAISSAITKILNYRK